ncbi:hypothetical protein F4V43_09970 [Paenibacillus spiritus]|uniref:PKD domain-containing protein n=1 Tax=Paenibacillus spiritus TaxID=2496557 RepID=A0A5J5GA86_9BACL|nr:hypothetical protein [Paenibacillus spiritus]KAA9004938.1 hypothetical protein F4V43_09970 [Paenibacillus spiritus]
MNLKTIWRRVLAGILSLALLPWFNPAPEKVQAAGEIIEYNDVTIPARSYTASRPASYPGDPDWYASTMEANFGENTYKIKYDQVQHLLYLDMTGIYAPTRVEVHREPLGELAKNWTRDRAWHGYDTWWDQNLDLKYSDGTIEQLANTHGGTFNSMYENGDLSGYHNGSNEIRENPMGYYKRWYPDPVNHPDYYQLDYSQTYIVPSSYFPLDPAKKPVALILTLKYTDSYDTLNMNFNRTNHYPYSITDTVTIPLTTNKAPKLTLTSLPGSIMNESGFSTYNLEGYVQDPDNDTLDLIAEIPNVFYRKISIPATGSPKNFIIPVDTLTDSLSPGTYTIQVKAVDPFKMKAVASTSLTVTKRLKNKAYILVNEPVSISGSYADPENDPKYAERYMYEQDPGFFDNPMGLISDNGLWRSSRYTSFPYSGAYAARFQNRDNPLNDNRFDEFRQWSRDNLSSMTFLVHRKPVALFTARLNNGNVTIADQSYDLDHVSAPNKGIYARQWQYKKKSDETWTEGSLSVLPANDAYEIRLRVRDIDGPDGIGVWSDWYQVGVGEPGNMPPVALFTVTPNNVSYRKNTTVADRSFDPDNDVLDTYEWTLEKSGEGTKWHSWGPATMPPNIAAYGVGSYTLTLKVRDSRGLWSSPYSQSIQVTNAPPVAAFAMLEELYRDSVVTMENTTPDPDADGDAVSYKWNARLGSGSYYFAGSNRNQNVSVRSLITQMGLTERQAVSEGWEMRLTASDGTLSSNATRLFKVLNHVPVAAIGGSDAAVQYRTYTYTSADEDGDSSDAGNLQYYWRITNEDGAKEIRRTPNVQMDYDQPGVYTLEHWAVDPIGAKSNIAALKVNVAPNLPPVMTITAPSGTATNPTILDAVKDGDPFVTWSYSDPENDAQEKYRLEFYDKAGLLCTTAENTDAAGTARKWQSPAMKFEPFVPYSVIGRVYSKQSWSELSNERAFIVDNPPVPGFTLITDTGRDATGVPIYRTDTLRITSTAYDDDESKGDTITYRYYLKSSGGSESLISSVADWEKQFSTNGTFTIRQVVTDSLGLYREETHSLAVQNRLPTVELAFPSSQSSAKPTIASTLTPVIKWNYADPDGDEQHRYQVHIRDAATNAPVLESPLTLSGANQWTVPANALVENKVYKVSVTVYDGPDGAGYGSTTSDPRYLMANLLSVTGSVKHTDDWNANRQQYNLKQSGNAELPRGYRVFWAGEKFVLYAEAAGLPDTITAQMDGGRQAELHPLNEDRTLWTGEMSDPAFALLPDGPLAFTFTARNAYHTKVDRVVVEIRGAWDDYFRNHRVK